MSDLEFNLAERRKLTDYLADYVSAHKKELIEEILAKRTRYLTLVMEDIYKPHNASAVIRTAECLGVQDIHVVEVTNEYQPNPYVLRGALKWMTIKQYSKELENSTEKCFRELRANGYQIVATDVSSQSIPIQDLEINKKTALVMGTEYTGISNYARENADQLVTIPMCGFTESLNVSVSAAICMNHLLADIRKRGIGWQLSEEDKETLRFEWYRSIPTHAESLINHFMKENPMR